MNVTFPVLALSLLAGAASALTPSQQEVALRGLDDEYHALATYQAVIDTLGPIRPFINIIEAERTHAAALAAVLENAGVPVPPNPYLDGTKPAPVSPATKGEACALGVQAEIANASLYDDQLLPLASGDDGLIQVLIQLRDASQEMHLPAFQRCAQ